MLVQVVSDLHTEMRPEALAALPGWRDPAAELLILAGDICKWSSPAQIEKVMTAVTRWPRILWVPGNHEYYGGDPISCTMNALDAAEMLPTIDFVPTPGFLQIYGFRFLVGTMWYDEAGVAALPGGNPKNGRWREAKKVYQFSDFFSTRNLAPWVYEQNRIFRRCLEDVNSGDVVVTHHLPSPRSIPAQYRAETDNCFYVTDVEAEIEARRPRLWVHGHTHTPFDYRIGDTRVVCNPLGYHKERGVDGYKPLTLELP